MKPYSKRNFLVEEEIFNNRLSRCRRTRMLIRNNGSKLNNPIKYHPDKVDLIVKCICLLRNILIDKEGIYHLNLLQNVVSDSQFDVACK